jgi:hypothetical protein
MWRLLTQCSIIQLLRDTEDHNVDYYQEPNTVIRKALVGESKVQTSVWIREVSS